MYTVRKQNDLFLENYKGLGPYRPLVIAIDRVKTPPN
jgi:hypothetical protein